MASQTPNPNPQNHTSAASNPPESEPAFIDARHGDGLDVNAMLIAIADNLGPGVKSVRWVKEDDE